MISRQLTAIEDISSCGKKEKEKKKEKKRKERKEKKRKKERKEKTKTEMKARFFTRRGEVQNQMTGTRK